MRWLWFPIALAVTLLLSLPGLALFVFYWQGVADQANAWLSDHFGVQYQPALPRVWLLPLALLPFLILLLYFLRLKRRPLQVPSTYLWKKSIEDLRVNSLFRWLRRNILLVLQLVLSVLLFYSALGLHLFGTGRITGHYILLIDSSASMSVADADGLSRLQWAKNQALKIIDEAADDAVGMVIEFNSRAAIRQAYTKDKGLLRQAVQRIGQTQRSTNLEEALRLAGGLANPTRSTEQAAVEPENVEVEQRRTFVQPEGTAARVFLLSDGRFRTLNEESLQRLSASAAGKSSPLGNLKLHFVRAGSIDHPASNIGIIVFDAQQPQGKRPANADVTQLQVLVGVANFTDQARPVELELRLFSGGVLRDTLVAKVVVPGAVHDSKKGVLAGYREHVFSNVEARIGDAPVLEVRLWTKDDFTLDDRAWLAFGPPRKAEVLIVSPGNSFLEAFFKQPAIEKLASVRWLKPEELDDEPYTDVAINGKADLVIFDRCAPATVERMPVANSLFFDRPPPPFVRGAAKRTNPTPFVTRRGRRHPLFAGLTTLWDLHIQQSWSFRLRGQEAPRKAKTPPSITPLLEAEGNHPLIFQVSRRQFTDVVIAFPLLDEDGGLLSDWPLRPGFPLFLRNVLIHLGHAARGIRGPSYKAGESATLVTPPGATRATIVAPDGRSHRIDCSGQRTLLFSQTDLIGLYSVTYDQGPQQRFTVNLLDENESNIVPQEVAIIGDDSIPSSEQRVEVSYPLWRYLLLAVVALLLVEWYIYNRRVQI